MCEWAPVAYLESTYAMKKELVCLLHDVEARSFKNDGDETVSYTHLTLPTKRIV